MTLESLLFALEAQPFAQAIRQGSMLFPWIESIHVLAIVIVVGVVVVMDLGLLGLASHSRSLRTLIRDANALTWAAFVLAAVTGSLLFASAADTYAKNPAFLLKFAVMAIAGANMAVFHFTGAKHAYAQAEGGSPAMAAKAAGLISLTCWIVVVIAARWVGFLSN